MDFERETEGVKEEINRELKAFLDGKAAKAQADGLPQEYFETVRNIREFILRAGKRLRPMLFYYGYKCAGGADDRAALRAAVSSELLHAGLLIHDDVMDRDNMRHAGPSMHFKYETDYGMKLGRGDLRHFGYSMAISAGDAALSWGYEALVDNGLEDRSKVKAVALMSRIITETALGQMLDTALQVEDGFDERKIERVFDYKTARYTIAGPLQLGAVLAGAGEAELDFIADFSIPLGIAFQIQDDVLDIFGDTKRMGKPAGSDLREGKKTLLISYALRNASPEDSKTILARLGKRDVTEEELIGVREIIERSGALKHAQDKISELTQDFLDKVEDGGDGIGNKYAPLKDLAGYLLKRNE